jgi:hypothetical protein
MQKRELFMMTSASNIYRFRTGSLIPVVGILILAGLGSLWAIRHFSAEARVRRATVRVLQLVEKTGEESPVALGLAANRLGRMLTPHMGLSLDETGLLTDGRQETVQLFAQIRQSVDVMTFDDPHLIVEKVGKDRVNARVMAQYRFVGAATETYAGKGVAALEWINGKDGWQIVQAVLQAEEGAMLPKGWK